MLVKLLLLIALIAVPIIVHLYYSGPRPRKTGRVGASVAKARLFVRRTFLALGTLIFLFGGVVCSYHAVDNPSFKYIGPALVFYGFAGLFIWWGVLRRGYQ